MGKGELGLSRSFTLGTCFVDVACARNCKSISSVKFKELFWVSTEMIAGFWLIIA
jgi:hypothetical protein